MINLKKIFYLWSNYTKWRVNMTTSKSDSKLCYEFNNIPDAGETTVKEIDTDINIDDIGTCFPLSEIQNFNTKNARGGGLKINVTMKTGSILKLMLPKECGLGMPHH